MDKRYFLTVDRCNKGNRGIFCSYTGECFSKESPYSEDEIWKILGPFDLILFPESTLLSEEELKAYCRLVLMEEYSNQYGVALKESIKVGGPENGYADQVASLYQGMDLKKFY